jgi:PAS domain S-box-containing protein
MFKTLAEESPNMIFINKRGRIAYANKKCEEVMGYSREEFYSPDFNFMVLIAPESRSFVKENLKKHMRGEEIPPYEYKLLTKDGREIVGLHTTSLLDFDGEKAVLGIITDVSKHKQMEDELKASHELIQSIYDSIPDAIIVGDTDLNLTSCNESVLKIFGYPPEELTGKNYSILIPEKRLNDPIHKKRLEQLLREGRLDGEEFIFKRKNGEEFPADFSAVVIKDGEGNATSIIGTIKDITNRKKGEKKLHQKIEELEKWQRLTVGREVRMAELKKEIKELKEKLKKYESKIR